MQFVILDGAQEPCPMDGWLERVERSLAARGHLVRRLRLREMRICQCRGCFGCWVKTPGRCVIRDDAEEILRAFLEADVAAIASPIVMGLTTALSRRATERLLPLLHPYFEVVECEIHHRARYTRYPRVVLLHGHEGCDPEDAEIIEALCRRATLNLRSTFAFAASTARAPEEVCDALARL